MHSYADQRTHDFFLNRDYPPVEELQQVFKALKEEPQSVEELRAESRMVERSSTRRWRSWKIHGGARMDFSGT